MSSFQSWIIAKNFHIFLREDSQFHHTTIEGYCFEQENSVCGASELFPYMCMDTFAFIRDKLFEATAYIK